MKGHNLDIAMYSLQELLNLFNIDTYDITREQILAAKKKVLMTHPDKSRLPSEYFLFYKKAFEVVLNFYNDQTKQNAEVRDKDYSPLNNDNEENQKIKSQIQKADQNKFSVAFNELFEKNMVKTIDKSKNEWFQSEEPKFETPTNVNPNNMRQVFDNMKQQQQIVVHRDVQVLHHSGGTNIYDDDDDNTNNEYLSCDPFSKLKFDDLRKVHKDQTIFNVSENDLKNVKQYNNVEQFQQARNSQSLNPMDERKAQQQFQQQEKLRREHMMQKQHKSQLQTMEYEKKNKSVMASMFLQLQNG